MHNKTFKNEKYEYVNNSDIILANNIYQQIKDYNVENLVIVMELIKDIIKGNINGTV